MPGIIRFSTMAYSTAMKRYFYYWHNGFLYDKSFMATHGHEKQLTSPEKCPAPGAAPLVKVYTQLYPELGEPPFGVDFNLNRQRKRYSRPGFLFDLIHLLAFRRLPRGPVLWRPYSNTWYYYHHMTNSGMPHPALENLMWFEPNNPFIKWENSTQTWRISMSVSRSEIRDPEATYAQHQRTGKRPRAVPAYKRLNTSYPPWRYAWAVQAAADFRYKTCGIDPDNDPYAQHLTTLPFVARGINRITGKPGQETERDALAYWTWHHLQNMPRERDLVKMTAAGLPV